MLQTNYVIWLIITMAICTTWAKIWLEKCGELGKYFDELDGAYS